MDTRKKQNTTNAKRTAKVRVYPLNEADTPASPGSRTPPYLQKKEAKNQAKTTRKIQCNQLRRPYTTLKKGDNTKAKVIKDGLKKYHQTIREGTNETTRQRHPTDVQSNGDDLQRQTS